MPSHFIGMPTSTAGNNGRNTLRRIHMYAVVRETTYPVDKALADRPEFTAFQDAHAAQPGYRGTVVTHVGNGQHVTVTLWDTAEHMAAARDAIGPAVKTLIEPLMLAPAKLVGTGEVAYIDIGAYRSH
jgi:hypothetical protein